MSGVRWLYISGTGQVFKVPKPKKWKFKAVRELAGQEVLRVMLYYETKERKPYKLLLVEFDRIDLDSEGVYEHNDEDAEKAMYNFLNFAYKTPEILAESEEPLTIPLAPVLPLEREKEALYSYLKKKIPTLAKDAPSIVENRVKLLKKSHEENISLIRDAKKLRG